MRVIHSADKGVGARGLRGLLPRAGARRAVCASAAVGVLAGVVVAVPTVSWAATSPVDSQLVATYAAARGIPAADVAGIAAGSLDQASVGSTQWAVATFMPAMNDSASVLNGFQDAANSVAFTSTGNGEWQVVAAGGLFSCPGVLPAAAQQALKLTDTSVCSFDGGTPSTVPSSATPSASQPIDTSVANIAKDNIGVGDTPATTSFSSPDCNPFTAMLNVPVSSAGCGVDPKFHVRDRAEFWCADFAKWVWRRAGVTSDLGTLTPAAASFYTWGVQHHEKINKNGLSFSVGDAIVFYPATAGKPNGTYADHVGIIVGYNKAKGTITLVNGDWGGGKNISVKSSTVKISSLKKWAATTWGHSEFWALINPNGK